MALPYTARQTAPPTDIAYRSQATLSLIEAVPPPDTNWQGAPDQRGDIPVQQGPDGSKMVSGCQVDSIYAPTLIAGDVSMHRPVGCNVLLEDNKT